MHSLDDYVVSIKNGRITKGILQCKYSSQFLLFEKKGQNEFAKIRLLTQTRHQLTISHRSLSSLVKGHRLFQRPLAQTLSQRAQLTFRPLPASSDSRENRDMTQNNDQTHDTAAPGTPPNGESGAAKSKNQEKNEAKRLAKLAKYEAKMVAKKAGAKPSSADSKASKPKKEASKDVTDTQPTEFVNTTPKGEKKGESPLSLLTSE
jgi:hypothetical protein